MDYFDQIATGVRPPPPPSARINEAPPSLQEQQLSYALAKQVPDMARGFTIATSYGDITIPPGWMGDYTPPPMAPTRPGALDYQRCASLGVRC